MKRSKIIQYCVGSLLLLASVVFGGCGTTHKVIKSGDADAIYNYALEMYNAKEWSKASNLLRYITSYYEGSSRDDTVKFYYARTLFKTYDYQGAASALDEFRRQYGRSIFLEDAEGMYTLSHYLMAPGATRDSDMISSAIMVIDEFLSRYPDSAQRDVFTKLRAELVARLHEKSFANAFTYYKTGYYKSAIVAFRNALREYPESEYREMISYYIVASAYELANNSVISKKEDRFLDMVDAYYTFIAAYAESEYRSEVDRMLKRANSYLDSVREKEDDPEGLSDDKEKEKL
ncbi:MAG: outer membrane protein assembly factor BamD [Rikenellaceae bacterium]